MEGRRPVKLFNGSQPVNLKEKSQELARINNRVFNHDSLQGTESTCLFWGHTFIFFVIELKIITCSINIVRVI
jgi:hypothetical protein